MCSMSPCSFRLFVFTKLFDEAILVGLYHFQYNISRNIKAVMSDYRMHRKMTTRTTVSIHKLKGLDL